MQFEFETTDVWYDSDIIMKEIKFCLWSTGIIPEESLACPLIFRKLLLNGWSFLNNFDKGNANIFQKAVIYVYVFRILISLLDSLIIFQNMGTIF